MYSKDQFLASIEEETKICKHLAEKLNTGDLEIRLAEGSRDTLELLRYLTYCVSAPIGAILGGGMEHIKAKQEGAANMPAEAFVEHMDRQLEEVRGLVADKSESDLQAEVELPWGGSDLLGGVLVNVGLRFVTAYRMQLFLHAKAAGHGELGTYNCWMGVDPPSE